MISDVDPFSMVYSALWKMAEETALLTDLVKLGNRIRYDTMDSNPEKRAYMEADCPELVLQGSGVAGNLWATSTASSVTRRYSWIIVSGDMRVTEKLLPVEWSLFVAMHGWKEVLGALRWNNKNFVTRMNLTEVQEGILRPIEPADGPRGWYALWGIEVDLNFDTKDLQALR